MSLTDKRLSQGFTLVELVIVIIVLGVLSAVAIPKFVNRSGFEDYALRDQLIARLRLVQLQNMNADPSDNATKNACYWLVVSEQCFYNTHATRVASNCSIPTAPVNVCSDDSYNQYASVQFPNAMLESNAFHFDQQGRLLINNTPITSAYEIALNGDNDVKIIIESEGFIHAQ